MYLSEDEINFILREIEVTSPSMQKLHDKIMDMRTEWVAFRLGSSEFISEMILAIRIYEPV